MQFKSAQVELRDVVNAFPPLRGRLCFGSDQKTENAQTISRMLLYGQEKPIRHQSSETNNKINTGYPIQKRSVPGVQLNSWQAVIKLWDGFCGPLEVRMHLLPPPDSDCVMLDVKLQLLNLQWFRVLGASFSSALFSIGALFSRFRCFVFEFWVLRFRDLGASFLSFGCFVLRSSFSSALFSKLPKFTSANQQSDPGTDASSVWNFSIHFQMSFHGETSGCIAKCQLFSQSTSEHTFTCMIYTPQLMASLGVGCPLIPPQCHDFLSNSF